MSKFHHIPVLSKEVVKYLSPQKGEVFVDGTLGLGGHARMLLEKGAKVIGVDKDMLALKLAKKNLKNYQNITFVHDDFSNIGKILADLKIDRVDGILLDLGISSMQLEDAMRGFSFQKNAGLDMRMNKKQGLSAFDIINSYDFDDLVKIFLDYGEEKEANAVAKKIVLERQKKPINTTLELVQIIGEVMPNYRLHQKKHFATNIFRSLRIEVNNEIGNLIKFLSVAPGLITDGGRLVIISFHSIEDRVVKRAYKMIKLKGKADILTPRPVIPSFQEIWRNKRARSAKLRAIEII